MNTDIDPTPKHARSPIVAIAVSTISICGVILAGMAWLFEQRLSHIVEKYEATLATERQKFQQEIAVLKGAPSEIVRSPEKHAPEISGTTAKVQEPAPQDSKPVMQVAPHSEMFVSGSIYPIGFDFAKIGTPLSKIREAYPNGKLRDGHFVVQLSTGLFVRVFFWFDSEQKTPNINGISFIFRDTAAAKYAKSDAALKLSGLTAQKLMDGEKLRWYVGGVRAELNPEKYSLERRSQ